MSEAGADKKRIQIFIASSTAEFREERDKIEQLFNRLNKIAWDKGIFFDVERCEEMSVSMNLHRKQDDYNQAITNSKYFYMFIGNKLGEYTREEFDVAWDSYKKTQEFPVIYPFFIKKDESEQPGAEVREFIRYLQEKLGHFTNEYDNFDAVLLRIALELVENQEIGGVIFQDGQAKLNGEELLSLDNVSMYNGNTELSEICERLEELDEIYFRLIEEDADDYSGRVRKELESTASIRNQLYERKHQIEDALYENYRLIMEKKAHEIHPHEEKAMRLMSQGKIKEAFIILQDSQLETEVKGGESRAYQQTDSYLEKLKQYLSLKRYQISIIKTTGLNPAKIEDIRNIYENMIPLCIKWQTGFEILFEYASFLQKHKDYKRAIEIAEKLKCCYILYGNAKSKEMADSCLLYGRLLYDSKLELEAETEYKKALAIYDTSATPEENKVELYNELGELCWRLKRYREGQEYLDLAIKAYEADKKVENRLTDGTRRKQIAKTYNIWGLMDRMFSDYSSAIDHYGKSKEIRNELMKSSFVDYAEEYSETCNNLAFIYIDIGAFDKAIKLLKECVEVREKLMSYTPDAVKPKLAVAYTNTAYALTKTGSYDDAIKYVNEGIRIREELVEENKEAYLTALAVSYKRCADIKSNMDSWKEAEESYLKAISIWEENIQKNYRVYCSWLAEAYAGYGMLLMQMGNNNAAKEYANKAYLIRKDMLEQDIQGKNRLYVWICACFIRVLIENGDLAEAEELLNTELDEIIWLDKKNEDSHKIYGYGATLLFINKALLYLKKEKFEEAGDTLTTAKENFQDLVQQNPEVYGQIMDFLEVMLERADKEARDHQKEEQFYKKYSVRPDNFVNLRYI